MCLNHFSILRRYHDLDIIRQANFKILTNYNILSQIRNWVFKLGLQISLARFPSHLNSKIQTPIFYTLLFIKVNKILISKVAVRKLLKYVSIENHKNWNLKIYYSIIIGHFLNHAFVSVLISCYWFIESSKLQNLN